MPVVFHSEDHELWIDPRWGHRPAAEGRLLRLIFGPVTSVDPARYYHFGLRGPRNERGTLSRFIERGVEREHIYTYREIRQARQTG